MYTIKKKNDNTGYYTRLSLGTDTITGKRTQKYVSARTKAELEEKITKIKMKNINGTLDSKPLKITFEMLAEEYLKEREHEVENGHISKTTFAEDKRKFKTDFIPYFQKANVEKINLEVVKQFQTHLKNQPKRNVCCKNGIYKNDEVVYVSHSTVNKKMKLFKSFLRFAFDKGYIPNFSLQSIRNLPEVKKEINFWTPQEFMQFIKVVNQEETDLKVKAFFTLAYTTGARLSEVLACNINDINMVTKQWYIHSVIVYDENKRQPIIKPTTKTKTSTRRVKIDDLTFSLLQEVIDNRLSDYIFSYSCELPKSDYYTERFKKYIEKSGVRKIRFHDLRHSHASFLIANGEDRFTISKRLGHSSTMFTESVYGHLFPDKQDKITSLLEQTFLASVQ